MDANDRGVIKRIYLENFVTYDKVTIKPGRNLNLLIGPNGTGKSTVVCAIVLGLNGKPKLVGRGVNVKDYVKQGCQSSKIEIELQDTGNRSIVIVRCFDLANRSTWMLNGRAAHNKEISDVIKDLNIQVDNLCQFLPQDKVQSFSEMDSQELLENTERSVGDPKLVEYHEKLKAYRAVQRNYEATAQNKSALLESERQKYEGMKDIVGNIKEKKAATDKITKLKQKRAWMLYEDSYRKMGEAKVGRDKAATEMKKLDEQLKPINDRMKNLEAEIKELKRTVESNNTKLSSKMSIAEKSMEEARNAVHDIRGVETNRQHKIQAEESRDQEINAVVQQKNKLDKDLEVMLKERGSESELNAEDRRTDQELNQKRKITDRILSELSASKAQVEMINNQIKGCMTEMQAVKDVDAKRLELLRRFNNDAYLAVLWLRKNRNLFTSVIHEPMMLTLQVIDAKYAKYFENTIALRDLCAFVCEDKTDMNRLMQCLREGQNLSANVVFSDPHRNVSKEPRIPLEQIRQYGFHHYLIDLINAPPTVVNYLVTMYQINNIPLGDNRTVQDNFENIPPSLRRFFSQDTLYAVNFSKYSNTRSTRANRVAGNSTLSIIQDIEKLRSFESRLANLTANKERLAEDIDTLNAKLTKANEELEVVRAAKLSAQLEYQKLKTLSSRIILAEKQIKNLQNARMSVDDIKTTAASNIQRILQVQLEFYTKYNNQVTDCRQYVTANVIKKVELDSKQEAFATQTNESRQLREQCALAEQLYRRLDSELAPLRRASKDLYDLAMKSTDNLTPKEPEFKKLQRAFARLPLTIDEIDAALDATSAKAYCLGDNADAEAILRSYETLQANVQRLEEEIERMNVDRTTVDRNVDELLPLWLTPLQELVGRINKNFSTYFGLMSCAGEVSLKEGEHRNDFDKYGLTIRVKFRDADQLQELTRQRQSGGERAVTTAVYMIALQELSRVPFRCVDEINQGMDADNERRVFELIVQITEKEKSSQYFLITPKLLPDLEYGNNVTLHCVFNGSFMVPSEAHDTSSYIQRCIENRRR